jgi:hypothetical protein
VETMTEEAFNEINNFIKNFKSSDDVYSVYAKFDYRWLNSFNQNLVEDVKIEYESIEREFIVGYSQYSEMIIEDFINSLETLLANS